MEFQVDINNVILKQFDQVESGEYNVTECQFTFSDEYAELTKKAVFTGDDGIAYVETIINNKCSIPSEILAKSQKVVIGVYGYNVEGTELLLRYSPVPSNFFINQGSYKEAQNSIPPTPTEIEQLQAQITTNANNIDTLEDKIIDIELEQSVQDGKINANTDDIIDIKAEQTQQNTKIQNNTDNISTLQSTKADKTEIPTKTSDLINDSDFVSDSNYVHTDNNFTNVYKNQINQNASDISNLQSNKADKTEIPTKVSQLTNDSGYITKNVNDLANYYKKSETYDKNEIDTKISSVYRYKGSVATYGDLPSTDLTIGDVYNVESDGSNYAWTGTTWDKLGGEIDLSDYYTKTQADSLLSAKANVSDVYAKTDTYNKTEVNTLLNDKVDKVQGKNLSTNDFTDEYKNQITTNQTAISNIKDGTTIDSFGDVETALSGKEDKTNKVTSITDESTDVEYPSAKCVYDELEAKQSEIDNLETDVEDLRNASLKVTGTGTDITLNNTASARLLDIELKGQTSQETNKITYKCDGTETGTYYLTYDNINYQFTMPTVSSGDILVFNTDTKVLSLNDTAITTTTGATGSQLTFIATPNQDYEQAIQNVTGNALVKIQNKNLFVAQKIVNDSNSSSVYIDNDGNIYFKTHTSLKIKPSVLKENTAYTFKLLVHSNNSNTNIIQFKIKYTDGTISTGATAQSTSDTSQKTLVFRTNPAKTIDYIYDEFTNNQPSTLVVDGSMILEGSYTTETIPSYVPHQEQNLPFTFASGQFLADDGKLKDVGIYNEWKKKIFDGTESWYQYGDNIALGNWDNNLSPLHSYTNLQGYKCNIAIETNVMSKTLNNNTFSTNNLGNVDWIVFHINMSVEDWKAYLAEQYANGTPVEVEYKMAQPEIIPYNSTQQAQYEAIKNARSYADVTYITSTSDEEGFDMKVTAIGDINKVIENLQS